MKGVFLMKFFGFRGGVHPPENKIQTEHLPIEKLESPNEIFVPLLQHIGAPLNPIVNVGDKVLKGQKIADAEGLAVPVHSPVSGTVTKIESRVFPLTGKVMTIFIENDKKEEWAELSKIENWEEADKKALLDIIREKGIVGIGGATFPTHVKLNPPPNTKLDSKLGQTNKNIVKVFREINMLPNANPSCRRRGRQPRLG